MSLQIVGDEVSDDCMDAGGRATQEQLPRAANTPHIFKGDGYSLSLLSGQDIATSRTIAIEVATQNSGMAAAIAAKLLYRCSGYSQCHIQHFSEYYWYPACRSLEKKQPQKPS